MKQDSRDAWPSFEDILKAYKNCRKGKQPSIHQLKFEQELGENLLLLWQEITERRYKPSVCACFVVTNPKPREIFAAHFRDRVVHHLLVSKLDPFWEKKLSLVCFACRKNMGTHGALKNFEKQVRSVSRGGRRPVWVLQLDVQSFFVTIQRPILCDLLLKHCRNQMMTYLINVVFSHDSRVKVKCLTRDHRSLIGPGKSWFDKPKDSGIPIGNLTSQFAANAYLNDLDHFIVRKLKPAGYLRYMDDLTLLGLDPKCLSNFIPIIDNWLREFRGQNLNPKKTNLTKLTDGIDYLGVKIIQDFSTNRGVKFYCSPKRKWGFVKRAKELERQGVPQSSILDSLTFLRDNSKRNNAFSAINSYLGLIKHTQTFQLRKKTLAKLEKKILKEDYVETSKDFTSITFK